jgi:hypothetical protein
VRSSHAYCAVHLRHFCGRYVHEPKARHSSPSSSARNSRCKGIGSRRGSWLATTLLALWVSSALCVLPARLWLLSTSLLRAGLSSISLLCALSVLPALLRALLRGTRPYQAPSFAAWRWWRWLRPGPWSRWWSWRFGGPPRWVQAGPSLTDPRCLLRWLLPRVLKLDATALRGKLTTEGISFIGLP